MGYGEEGGMGDEGEKLLIELRNGKWASSEHVLLQTSPILSNIWCACLCATSFFSLCCVSIHSVAVCSSLRQYAAVCSAA